jgi:hypothetical protein
MGGGFGGARMGGGFGGGRAIGGGHFAGRGVRHARGYGYGYGDYGCDYPYNYDLNPYCY